MYSLIRLLFDAVRRHCTIFVGEEWFEQAGIAFRVHPGFVYCDRENEVLWIKRFMKIRIKTGADCSVFTRTP